MAPFRNVACLAALLAFTGCDEAPKPVDVETDTGATGSGSPIALPPAATLATGSATPADLRHLELLRAAAKRDPPDDAAQVALARHCVKLSRWDEAHAAVTAALAINPDNATAKRLERYLPELEAATTVAQRRELELKMTSESLQALGRRLESAGAVEAMQKRRAQHDKELRERFGITDGMLRDQEPMATPASMRLTQALRAIDGLPEQEAHIRKVLDAEPARLDAWVKLLDVLIEQKRDDDAINEVAVARRAAPGDLVLRLYEHHLPTLKDAKSDAQRRGIVTTLAMERVTLVTMISDAKTGKLAR